MQLPWSGVAVLGLSPQRHSQQMMTQMKNKQTDTHSTRMEKNEFNLYIFLLVLSQRWRESTEGYGFSRMRPKVDEKGKKGEKRM